MDALPGVRAVSETKQEGKESKEEEGDRSSGSEAVSGSAGRPEMAQESGALAAPSSSEVGTAAAGATGEAPAPAGVAAGAGTPAGRSGQAGVEDSASGVLWVKVCGRSRCLGSNASSMRRVT